MVILVLEGWDRSNLIVVFLSYLGWDDIDHSIFIYPFLGCLIVVIWSGGLFIKARRRAQEYAEAKIETFCAIMERTFGASDAVVQEGALKYGEKRAVADKLEKLQRRKRQKIRSSGYDFLSSVSLFGPRYGIAVFLVSLTITSASARLYWDSWVSIESTTTTWVEQNAPDLSVEMSKGDYEHIGKIVAYARDLSMDETVKVGQTQHMSQYINKYNGLLIDAHWEKKRQGCQQAGCVNTTITISRADGSLSKTLFLDCSKWAQMR